MKSEERPTSFLKHEPKCEKRPILHL